MGRMGVLTDGGMLSSGSIQLVVSSAGLVWLCDVLPARCCSWLRGPQSGLGIVCFSPPLAAAVLPVPQPRGMPGGLAVQYDLWRHMVCGGV